MAFQVIVTWRGSTTQLHVDSPDPLLGELGQALEQRLGASFETLKLLVPGSKGQIAPSHNPEQRSSEAGLTSGSKILLLASRAEEVSLVRAAKDLPLMRGFEDELKRAARRRRTASALLQPPRAEYSFDRYETWQRPGLQPPPAEALKLLYRLANDPGIRGVMDAHRYRVGLLSEMPPEGKVGVSPVCILGVNINAGQEISLRLRTDDLKGFRKYERIRETLIHELAHMEFGEHDTHFKQLNSQLGAECAAINARYTGGHSLLNETDPFGSDAARTSELDSVLLYDDDNVMTATARLSGKTLRQLAKMGSPAVPNGATGADPSTCTSITATPAASTTWSGTPGGSVALGPGGGPPRQAPGPTGPLPNQRPAAALPVSSGAATRLAGPRAAAASAALLRSDVAQVQAQPSQAAAPQRAEAQPGPVVSSPSPYAATDGEDEGAEGGRRRRSGSEGGGAGGSGGDTDTGGRQYEHFDPATEQAEAAARRLGSLDTPACGGGVGLWVPAGRWEIGSVLLESGPQDGNMESDAPATVAGGAGVVEPVSVGATAPALGVERRSAERPGGGAGRGEVQATPGGAAADADDIAAATGAAGAVATESVAPPFGAGTAFRKGVPERKSGGSDGATGTPMDVDEGLVHPPNNPASSPPPPLRPLRLTLAPPPEVAGNGVSNSASGSDAVVLEKLRQAWAAAAKLVSGAGGPSEAVVLQHGGSAVATATPGEVLGALETLETMLGNAAQLPNEDKYRRVRLANGAFQRRLGRLPGGVELLRVAGFVEEGGTAEGAVLRLRRNDPGLLWLVLSVAREAREQVAAQLQVGA